MTEADTIAAATARAGSVQSLDRMFPEVVVHAYFANDRITVMLATIDDEVGVYWCDGPRSSWESESDLDEGRRQFAAFITHEVHGGD